MGTNDQSDEFKRDAVHQITVRGYTVREGSRRLGVSAHSLYTWLRLFSEPVPRPDMDHEAERAGASRRAWRPNHVPGVAGPFHRLPCVAQGTAKQPCAGGVTSDRDDPARPGRERRAAGSNTCALSTTLPRHRAHHEASKSAWPLLFQNVAELVIDLLHDLLVIP